MSERSALSSVIWAPRFFFLLLFYVAVFKVQGVPEGWRDWVAFSLATWFVCLGFVLTVAQSAGWFRPSSAGGDR